jgi:hypothetical protein
MSSGRRKRMKSLYPQAFETLVALILEPSLRPKIIKAIPIALIDKGITNSCQDNGMLGSPLTNTPKSKHSPIKNTAPPGITSSGCHPMKIWGQQ